MSTRQPLSVAFVWHMHQPFYKDLVTHEYFLPWVRLHAIKDYYDMVAYLDRYPKIRSVFNIVPSLFTQIEDYVNGTAKDKFMIMSLKHPEELSHEEKIFILKNFFMANWDTMIKPYPRYNDLLLKRGRFVTLHDISQVAARFSSQELLDLQVWFNLAWFGAVYKQNNPAIKGLLEKGKNYNEDDKKILFEKQIEIMRLILPKYKQLQESGQIEVTVTPFCHPILPLLCNGSVARVSDPGITLPKYNFSYPEDAKRQVKDAVAYYKKNFGADPEGMWPSEGSVSEDIIPIIAGEGIKWIATDEEILSSTLKKKLSAAELFTPYIVEKDGSQLTIIFRDHRISDDLGFVYAKWAPRDAAADIVGKLHKIADVLPDDGRNYLVSIILDGENAWEYYQNNGKDFFDNLYSMLSNDHRLQTVRVKDFLKENPPSSRLQNLFPGSWINHNFNIWIGHSEDNLAWDHLYKAREALCKAENAPHIAWDELAVAEGSDWNWWYGNDHSSDNDEDFDILFRKHLINIYRLIGQEHPKQLESPIKQMKVVKPTREPVYLIEPIIDGEVSNYYEWLSAGLYSVDQFRGAMHQIETVIRNIYYGFSTDTLYIRIDTAIELNCTENPELKSVSFEVNISKPKQYKIELSCDEKCEKRVAVFKLGQSGQFEKKSGISTFAVKKIIEIGVPFSVLEIRQGDEVQLNVSVKKDCRELESWPKGGIINFKAPDEDYLASSWFV
ncbi:MAG: glycoside hydrolase family 57 protein [Candidatus Saganbacteria bacterium]|nr:glycoside hydrolase family 57 protein [Candidatus Saganbacteria bacterium]